MIRKFVAVFLFALAVSSPVSAKGWHVRAPYRGGAPAMEAAIHATWPAHLHRQALNVAWCESRGSAHARNHQHLGHFQMGRWEWRTYGRGNPFNALDNSAAAYRYYRAAGGWGPWQCSP